MTLASPLRLTRIKARLWRLVLAPALAPVLAFMAGVAPLSAAWADPPGRVGRVNWTEGSVTLQQAPDPEHPADSIESPRNFPVTSGDVLSTDANARTEVSIGSTLVRLDENTRLEIPRLDDEATVLRVVQGSIALRVRSPEQARSLEVQVGTARMTPQGAGLFRIDAGDGTLSATAWQSGFSVETPGNHLTLTSGQRVEFGADAAWYRMSSPEIDRFASWAMNQNERYGDVAEVSSEMTGVDDLNQNGDWSSHPEYGRVWAPRVVAVDWAPYRDGRWVWVRPWGWTWVDAAPWGFAPFHYGRWVRWGPRWVWAPGTWVARPTYAPALVGWYGGTPGVSVSFSFGSNVGWFPLAPREIYAPYYPCSPHYVRHVNFSHVPRIERAELYVGGPGRVVQVPSYRYRDDWRYFREPGRRFNDDRGRHDRDPGRHFGEPGRRFDDRFDDRPPRIISPGTSPLRPPSQPGRPALPISAGPGRDDDGRGRAPGAGVQPGPTIISAPPGRHVPTPIGRNREFLAPPVQTQPPRQVRPDVPPAVVLRPIQQPIQQPTQPPARHDGRKDGGQNGVKTPPPNAEGRSEGRSEGRGEGRGEGQLRQRGNDNNNAPRRLM